MNIINLEQEILIKLLSSVLHDIQPLILEDCPDWEKLYRLSEWHGVSNMIIYGISRLNNSQKPSSDIMIKFQNVSKKAIAREAVQHIAFEQLVKAFEENRIPFIPLKGCLIKYLYPRPYMRLMADIDILIKEGQVKEVKRLMLAMGYTLEHKGENHDVYYRIPFMNVEVHHKLISEDSTYSSYLSKTWDRAILKSDSQYTYMLSCEDFYIYLLIHLTKHYTYGGTGIRSFMDLWVYNKHYKAEMNWSYIEFQLKEIGLGEFAANVYGLCEEWFGNRQNNGRSSELYEDMKVYIFSSGVYGTKNNSFITLFNFKTDKEKMSPKFAYLFRLFFPPVEIMKASFPFLNRRLFLLPACWVLRGIKCALFKRKHMRYMIGQVHSVSKDEIAKLADLHRRAGLYKR